MQDNFRSIGYMAGNLFRKRDQRFANAGRYKERNQQERSKKEGRSALFSIEDFIFLDDLSHCICPEGKRLYRSGGNVVVRNFLAVEFKGPKSACVPCKLRFQCLRHPECSEIRWP